MLTEINLINFKSYAFAGLPLAPMTFLIGPNASGKSNALEAIRLLSWLAKGTRVDDIERSIQSGDGMVRGSARDLFRNQNEAFALGAQISGAPGGWEHFYIGFRLLEGRLLIETESVTSLNEKVPLYQIDSQPKAHTDEIQVAYNNFRRGKNKPRIPCSNRQAVFYQLETPGRFEKDHVDSQKIIPEVTKALRLALQGIVFLDPRPSQMRQYSYTGDSVIAEDGRNLSSVLYRICREPQLKAELLQFIRSLPEQDIKDVTFIETERSDVMVRLVESFGSETRTVDAPLLSDGTLRVLAIAATLLTAEEGSLVVIEEIDNGVHPSRADLLVKQIERIAGKRQLRVLLTSHNPALLDALPDSALPDVLCCYRDPESGASQLVRLKDMESYPELIAQGPLGQLMTKRVLERFLKDATSPQDRQRSALEWLKSLEASTGKDTE